MKILFCGLCGFVIWKRVKFVPLKQGEEKELNFSTKIK